MASLHRFVIVVSAVTVVGAIQALVPDYPMQLLANDESIPYQSSLSATQKNIGLNLLRTENSTHIQQQINVENAILTVASPPATHSFKQSLDPYQDAQTGQLYFKHINTNDGGNISAQDNVVDSPFTLSDTLQTNVDITVTGMIARAMITQTFTNTSDNYVDGLYVFPLPQDAAVDHLMIEVADRKIEGQIKEKAAAKKMFEVAKQAGKKASLVEQRRPNLFTNNIANIGPNETITITIEYQQVLTFEKHGYSLRFPLGVTPRYAQKDATQEELETASLSTKTNSNLNNINITVKLNTGLQLSNIESEYHTIDTQTEPNNSYLVTLTENPVKMQDFVLSWQPELGSAPTSAHFRQFVNGSEYGMIMLYPPLPDEQLTLDREIIFVIDTSGSMSGDAIVQAKQALAYAIDDLSTRDKFNIIEFNSNAEVLWRKAKFADTENKMEAFDFISGLTANGGTEMRQALSMALLSEADPELFKQILFITDGSVSNESALMTLIENNLQQARLFTIGIGAAPNSHFMTEAAKSGKGTFTFIGKTSQVSEKMAELLNKINSPALTDIKLNLKGIREYQNFEMYPNVIADLYTSEPLIITYKQPLNNTLEGPMLIGMFNNSPWHFSEHTDSQGMEALLEETQKAKGINVLWARQKIAQLSRDKRKLAASVKNINITSNTSTAGEHNETPVARLIKEITNTALEHHIVSQYTSLIAVDTIPSAPATENTGSLQNSRQGQALPQTASNAGLNITIGLILLLLSLVRSKMTKQAVTKLYRSVGLS